MGNARIRIVNEHSIKVVDPADRDKYISESDAEMDARAVMAVESAIKKAEFCKKPIAKYDFATKRAYIEYANGEKEYAE